jgi:hypothetical protein
MKTLNKPPHYPTILRNIVFAAVPEYRAARWPSGNQRVSVSFDGHQGLVTLGIGLLTAGTEEIFDKVGTLNKTQKQILKELGGHYTVDSYTDVYYGVRDRYCHGFYFKVSPKQ